MARRIQKQPAPLVSVNMIFSREELGGLDFMGRALHLDRGAVVRRALDLLVLFGPQMQMNLEPGLALARASSGECGFAE